VVALTVAACATTSQVRLESPPKERGAAFAIDLVAVSADPPPGIDVAGGCRKAPLTLVVFDVDPQRTPEGDEKTAIHVDARFCPDRSGRYVWRARDADEPLVLGLPDGTYELDVADGAGNPIGDGVKIQIKNVDRAKPVWPRPWVPPDFRSRCVDVGCVVPCNCSLVGASRDGTRSGVLAILALVTLVARRRAR
jgi:MYXO-CTERM domain-containing protein